jgi:hypothetical protein
MRIQGYKKAIIQDCVFNGLSTGIIINDDDPRSPLPIPANKPIESGIYSICNNRFFANWQAMSFTYGGNHNGTIFGNYIEESVTKLIGSYGNSKTSNQLSSANHIISNNVWKNCPSVIIGLNDCVISNNVFDTVIGGVWIDIGTDYSTTNFNYGIVNLTIDNNVFNYTNTWTTASEPNMVPVTAMFAGIDDTYTAGQIAFYKNIKFTNNSVRTNAVASSSAGVIQLSTTNAQSTFENLTISNNDITITSDNGVFIYSSITGAYIQFNLSTKLIGNTFRRGEGSVSGGAGNFEITLANENVVSGSSTSVLQVSGNTYFGSTSTTSIFNLSRFAQCVFNDNQLYIGETTIQNTPVFRTFGCPRITANSNYVVKNTSLNNGTFIGFGNVTASDQTAMEKVRIQTRDNTMSRGFAGIYPIGSQAFPFNLFQFASGYGLLESTNDGMSIDPSIQWMPSISNVDAYCVVSPTNRDLTATGITYTNALTVVSPGYSCKTRLVNVGDASAFRLTSTAWRKESLLS